MLYSPHFDCQNERVLIFNEDVLHVAFVVILELMLYGINVCNEHVCLYLSLPKIFIYSNSVVIFD